jgi:hypothetical protein
LPQFQWLTYLQARQALAARLAITWQVDPSSNFWSDAELGLYLAEALRVWYSLTEQWNTSFSFLSNSSQTWYDLSTLSGSPRLRTLTDAYLYTLMQYHLLEPPTGAGTWTGTSQFSLADLQNALQRRRDEVIQVSGCNLTQLPEIQSALYNRRVYFPDSTLEPRRARFIPDSTAGPITLCREDTLQFDAFEPSYAQTIAWPSAWSVITEPPLGMDVDTAPPATGNYDVIALQSGPTFAPPAATLLGVPDDWAWVAKWGALADLLNRDSEATDRFRGDYAMKRYQSGLKAMVASNWLLSATVNGLPVDTPALKEMDAFSPEWEENAAAWSTLIQAGMDFVAPCPVGIVQSVAMILVGDAPVPVLDGDYVQVSRDVFDVILDYAQTLASFKMGGAEFAATKDLENNFMAAAIQTNKRLANMGLFRDVAGQVGQKQNIAQPRE